MRKVLNYTWTAFLILGFASGFALAEDKKFHELALDTEHSKLEFVSHAFFNDVPGKFAKWDGNIYLDSLHMDNSYVEVNIDVDSIDTGIKMRDNHLRGCSFFCVKNYPKIHFKSKKVEALPNKLNQYSVTGDLTIRDVTKEITFPAEIMQASDQTTIKAKASFDVKRRDYNINYHAPVNPIKNEVTVNFDVTTKGPTSTFSNTALP